MSIKKLFDTENSKNYLSEANEKDAFNDVESARNLKAISKRQKTFSIIYILAQTDLLLLQILKMVAGAAQVTILMIVMVTAYRILLNTLHLRVDRVQAQPQIAH